MAYTHPAPFYVLYKTLYMRLTHSWKDQQPPPHRRSASERRTDIARARSLGVHWRYGFRIYLRGTAVLITLHDKPFMTIEPNGTRRVHMSPHGLPNRYFSQFGVHVHYKSKGVYELHLSTTALAADDLPRPAELPVRVIWAKDVALFGDGTSSGKTHAETAPVKDPKRAAAWRKKVAEFGRRWKVMAGIGAMQTAFEKARNASTDLSLDGVKLHHAAIRKGDLSSATLSKLFLSSCSQALQGSPGRRGNQSLLGYGWSYFHGDQTLPPSNADLARFHSRLYARRRAEILKKEGVNK